MNLESFMAGYKQNYSESIILRIMMGLLKALDFIHRAGVMHRDIKPSNILITPDFGVLLCDFGLARTLPE